MTTAISTVITVAHTRRGARSIVAAARAPTDPNTRAVAAVARTMGRVSAKPSAISAENTAYIAHEGQNAALVDDTRMIDATNTATAPTPLAMRSQRGTRSAAETPTGANASIGETLYTWRAAIAGCHHAGQTPLQRPPPGSRSRAASTRSGLRVLG